MRFPPTAVDAARSGLALGLVCFLLETGVTVGAAWAAGTGGLALSAASHLARLGSAYLALGALVGALVGLGQARLPTRWQGEVVGLWLTACLVAVIAFALVRDATLLPGHYARMPFVSAVGVTVARWVGARVGMGSRSGSGLRLPVTVVGPAALAAFLLLGPRAAPLPSVRAARADRPDIVLVVVDTLRRDRVGAYGHPQPTTPTLDRLAREGVRYTSAWAPESWTLPSHASLFTGLFPSSHGAHNGGYVLPGHLPTLAGRLRDAGYVTLGWSANPWVGPASGLDRGFDHLDVVGVDPIVDAFLLQRLLFADDDLGGRAVADGLISALDSVPDEQPIFLFANLLEAHEPYGTVPPPWRVRWAPGAAPGLGRRWMRETAFFGCSTCDPSTQDGELQCLEGRWRVRPGRALLAQGLYDAGVAYADHQVGRVVEALARTGRLDRTVVVVTSDHGEFLGELGALGHGPSLRDELVEIPLIVRYPPAFPPGTTVDHPVNLVDVAPTLATLAGVSWPVDPHAVAAWTTGAPVLPGQPPDRPAVHHAEHLPVGAAVARTLETRMACDLSEATWRLAALQEGPLKLLWRSTGQHELFASGAEDAPLPLAPSEDQVRAAEAWLGALGEGTADGTLDDATRRRLEALGYVTEPSEP